MGHGVSGTKRRWVFVSFSNPRSNSRVSGGEEANGYARDRGFRVIELRARKCPEVGPSRAWFLWFAAST